MENLPVILISHGSFAAGALECAELLAGKQEDIEVLSVFLESNAAELQEMLYDIYKRMDKGNGVLVLVDMVGGTPWNLASHLLISGKKVLVYSGFNISVLLEVLGNRNLGLDEIGKIIAEAHAQSCVNAADLLAEGGKNDADQLC